MTSMEFEEALAGAMQELFGNCRKNKNIWRAVVEHMGVTDSSVIFEAALEPGLHPEAPWYILHFHCTLAQNVEEELVPKIVLALNELNNVISVGAFPAFGHFGYYPPLQQIFLTYRMPVNFEAAEEEFDNVRYYLGSLYEQLDIFTDFILFICDYPDQLTISDYMDYLDTISDLNDIGERMKALQEQKKPDQI